MMQCSRSGRVVDGVATSLRTNPLLMFQWTWPSPFWFIPDLQHEGGVLVSSSSEPMPVRLWLLGEAMQKDESAGGGDARPKSKLTDDPEHDILIKEFPWLSFLDEKLGFCGMGAPVKEKGGSSSKGTEGDDADPLPEEEEIVAGLTALERARDVVAAEGGMLHTHFVTRVRGRAIATDAEEAGPMGLQGVARTDAANDFCARRHVFTTFKCTWTTPH